MSGRKFYRLSIYVPDFGMSRSVANSSKEFVQDYAQALIKAARGGK